MFKNYFKTAWRNLWHNKATSFINLFGLSVGMTAAVFIFLWVQNEISVDNYHPGKENIYRITNAIQVSANEAWLWESSPMQIADFAKRTMPEVQQTARLVTNFWGGPIFHIGNNLFEEKTSAFVDKTWFDLFQYNFIAGNAAAFASSPFSIVLTEGKAIKYFGNTNVVGQTIKVDSVNYTVQAVVKNNPANTAFQFDVLLQMDGRLADPATLKNDMNWNNFGYITFLKLHPGASKKIVEGKLNKVINAQRENDNDNITLRPLKDLYFENDLQSSELPHGSEKASYIFSLLGFFLLLTACINYVNLTTAKASLRAKEVSVRKIVGAKKSHLFFQFVAESLTVSALALFVTLLLVQLCIPAFNAVTERTFQLPITSTAMWRVLLGTLLFATLLNGIYPAALLSSFKPLNVFRGKSVLKIRDGSVRKGLVVFQFGLSMILIIGTIVIYKQLQFIQTTNPGYNVSQVISLQVPYRSTAFAQKGSRDMFIETMKQSLKSCSAITAVSTGGNEIVNVTSASSGNADWDGHDTTFNPTIAHLNADADFKDMFRLQMQAGRWFMPGTTDEHNYIINETAAAQFHLHQPILGQRFTWGGDTGQIIGVVKDFHYKNLHEKIGPMVVSFNQGSGTYVFLKTVAGNNTQALNAAKKTWAQFIPDQPFTYNFLDDSFNSLYKTDIKVSQLVLVFSVIAVIISALGLFGLAAFTAEQRTKEIGIRKVLGASIQQITTLLSKDFVLLVIIAIVVASPIAWWAMNKWLQDFAYRINISMWVFVAAGSMALLIALISVSFQAIKAAVANPVKSLRTE